MWTVEITRSVLNPLNFKCLGPAVGFVQSGKVDQIRWDIGTSYRDLDVWTHLANLKTDVPSVTDIFPIGPFAPETSGVTQLHMDRSWDRGCHGPRAGAASVHVTELSWHGLQNPRPLIKDDGIAEVLLEEFLSPSKLALAQVEDLRQVTVLEMCVDTRENSLGNFGAHLPNLSQLKLNNSLLASIRDLGSSLSHLQILWMVRCGLADLDGISSLRSLKELYMSYNNISDLSQICLLEHLEVLDLEGNNIENIEQVRYLSLCKKLNMLTLEGNLICLRPDPEAAELPQKMSALLTAVLPSLQAPDYNYRAEVKKLIPHLQFLDDVPAAQTSLQATRKISEDWLIVKESIKESSADCSWFSLSRQSLSPSLRLSTNLFSPTPRPWPLPLDRLSWTIPLSSPGSPLPEGLFPEELSPDSSDLTHGVSRVLCGNPIKGLQERRQKLHDHSGRTTPQPLAPGSVGSRSQGPEELSGGEEDGLGWPQGLWAEYKSWKEEQQQQRLNMLLVGRSPPVWPQEEEEEEEEASMALEDQEEEEKAQGPPGPCPGSLSPAPDPSGATGGSGWAAGPGSPLSPPSLRQPSPPPFPSPGSCPRSEFRGRRLPPSLASISPLSSPEAGAHLGERLSPFRRLTALRSPGSQSQPEQPATRPAGGGEASEPKHSPRGLRPAPGAHPSPPPPPLEPAFGPLRLPSASKGAGCRQPLVIRCPKAQEKMLPLAWPLPGTPSALHRLPSLGPPATPPPTPPAPPPRSAKS
ncbi:leucine-rich repeat-containing protein 56 isoform X2 [Sminthopsis crassicaudata]|uniref:leucine-rich repeat-containing protein 56 isoform X2 n=1 Tax=Sminthopsis crassicaudata TaxID=9301 RepID=UPI003D69CD3C